MKKKIANLAETFHPLIRLLKLAKIKLATLLCIPTVNFNAVDIEASTPGAFKVAEVRNFSSVGPILPASSATPA